MQSSIFNLQSSLAQVRVVAAVAAAQLASLLSRQLRFGGGTNFPGVLARRIDPHVLRDLTGVLPEGVVLLSGTNGKTTTARMLSSILHRHHRRVIHNRAGANLVSGLTATAVAHSSLWGSLQGEIGLFETDEAALPQALAETQPRLVIIHNLFRDQLDRYGEVDTIAARWRVALQTLPTDAIVLLNADDPGVAYLGENLTCRVVYYGVEDTRHSVGAVQQMADSQFCKRCGAAYHYSAVFYGHVGHYRCAACGLERPKPQIRLERLILHGAQASRLLIAYEGGALDLTLPLPGFYNAVNALAACSASLCLGLTAAGTRDELEQFSAAFGRIERVQAGGHTMLMALIKNPVGASETVRMLVDGTQEQTTGLHTLVVINDRDADGTDVSWLWDAEFERLAGHVAAATVSGTRADDMAVRLKYAGLDPAQLTIKPDLAGALDAALAILPAGETLYVLPTYTAMLELRADMARRGWVRHFWQD